MAKSLARSLILHAPTVPRAVVTDSMDPELDRLFTHKIHHRPEYGSNVRQKMYLDKYSPFQETLFLDSDCLAVRDVEAFWNAFRSVPFGVCGVHVMRVGETNEFLDVDFILDHFNLQGIPKFNGGTYYFNRSPEAAALFATTRDVLNRAAQFKGLRRRGRQLLAGRHSPSMPMTLPAQNVSLSELL